MPFLSEETPSLSLSAEELSPLLATACPAARIDVAGAVPLPCPLPHADRWHSWVARGKHGGLDYLARDPEGRAAPDLRHPGARSVLIFAQRYTDGWAHCSGEPAAGGAAERDAPWTDRVARYARGEDYHRVLLRGIKRVLAHLRDHLPGLQARPFTDTGPFLEREYAWLAGLGFLGHNRCLINERLGSGLFLGVALTNLEITGLPPAGEPAATPLYEVRPRRRRPPRTVAWDHCGRCTRCLDACPTGALDLKEGLDSNLCLSTWTIEWQGRAPGGREADQGGLLFGCDICQSVCPWNGRAAQRAHRLPPLPDEYAPLAEHAQLRLADLATLEEEEFRRRFRQTPIWRCHPEGLRRNAERVLNNLEEENS